MLRIFAAVFVVLAFFPIPVFPQVNLEVMKVTTVTEQGFSLFIQRKGQTILFDTGKPDKFNHDVKRLGVDLSNVDIVVISHTHFDHAGGLLFFLELNKKATVYLSKNAQNDLEFRDFILKICEDYPGRIQFIDESTEIAKDTYIISGIKRNELSLDYVDHEIILVSKINNGLALFTGCGHSGIMSIIGTARRMFPNLVIKAVFGGFHLYGLSFEAEDAAKTKTFVEMIGKQMLASPILRIYTGHCTGVKPYQILKGICGSRMEYWAYGSTFFVF